MISRDAIAGIGSIVGYFSLFVGALGQAAFLSPITKPHLPVFVPLLLSLLPWLIVFTVTFTKQPFLSPRPFRYCLLFAMYWFAAVTIIAEVLHWLGAIPPGSPQFAGTMCRVLMHVGWLSALCVIPLCAAARQHELKRNV